MFNNLLIFRTLILAKKQITYAYFSEYYLSRPNELARDGA